MKKIIFVLITLAVFVGCKNDNKETTKLKKEEEQIENIAKNEYKGYKVTLDAVIEEEDVFLLYYVSEYEEDNKFSKINKVEQKVKGSLDNQLISFKIPNDILELKKIRLNLGKNRKQKNIKFNKLIIEKKGNKLELDAKQVARYFNTSINYLKINPNESTFTLMEKDEKYNPFIMSKGSFFSLIQKELIYPEN